MLEGSLQTQPFTDILQILATGQKSGLLTVTKGYYRARLFLNGGRLEYAHMTPGLHIGEVFVRMEYLTAFEVQTLLNDQTRQTQNKPLGILAIEAGYIDHEDLGRALKSQILDVLTELSTWTSGNFHLAERENGAELAMNHSFDTLMLLMETIERLDTWQKGRVDPDSVFERSGDPTRASLTPGGWEVLGYVNGKRSARTLAAEVDLPEGQVYHLLYELEQSGVIVPSSYRLDEAVVLILSMSHSLQRLIHLSLQRAGLRAYIAADVVSGLDFILSHRPRVVVVDDIEGEGWDFVKELRGISGHRHLPAVILSSEGKRAGGLFSRMKRPRAHVLEKPFRELELQQLVTRLAGHSLI